jgi:oligoendopeptidase F
VAAAPPTPQDLDAFREQADRFIAELDEEYYLHFAGLKERLELEPIYERHADLIRLERAQQLGAAVDGDRGVRTLWRFSCEGYLGDLTREHSEKIAALETELETEVDGEKVGYRMLRPTIANEPDRDKRQRLDSERTRLTDEHLNPVYLDAVQITQRAIKELGATTYAEIYRRFGFELEALARQCRDFLASTETLYEDVADALFRDRVGVGLDEAKRWDVPRVFRAESWDTFFPADKMLPALEATLGDLGIDLRAQTNVELDLEQRPSKTPRAFCAPIEVPDRVVLVIQPIGGADDWRALFHEAGHTEHFAHTSKELPMEQRRLGDNAVTEGWAMLLQHLTDEPAWLTRRLDVPRPEEFAQEGATGLLYFVRRYCAKLLYELEFHETDEIEPLRPRYVELLADALKIEPSDTDYLSDIDAGFYVTEYLRSWAFEAQLRAHLREKFGNAWFSKREAGSLLRELWSEGQRPTADELLHEVTGADVEMAAVADRVSETLRA